MVTYVKYYIGIMLYKKLLVVQDIIHFIGTYTT